MKNILVVGMGEIGRPLFEIIEENSEFNVFGYDLDENKKSSNITQLPSKVDVMHICIPCKYIKSFIQIVETYYEIYTPKLIIIHSTVPPTTTQFVADVLQSDCFIIHSPQFGTHFDKEEMKKQFLYYPHMIGPVTKEAGEYAFLYFKSIKLNPIIYSSSIETELIKVMETTYAGWMITFFNEFHRMAIYYGADFPQIVDGMIKTYYPNKNKPIWFPSVIEGHCIMQNINLLLQNYKAGFLELIKESNEFRKEEILDADIQSDIVKIKILRDEWKTKDGFVR
jgi:UDP-N-acetyl-D-mannosaminuronate dehydrogenase